MVPGQQVHNAFNRHCGIPGLLEVPSKRARPSCWLLCINGILMLPRQASPCFFRYCKSEGGLCEQHPGATEAGQLTRAVHLLTLDSYAPQNHHMWHCWWGSCLLPLADTWTKVCFLPAPLQHSLEQVHFSKEEAYHSIQKHKILSHFIQTNVLTQACRIVNTSLVDMGATSWTFLHFCWH